MALIAIPGPNVMLITSHALASGPRAGLWTVAGTGAAQVCQLLITALGLTSLLLVLSGAFEALRWAGVAYLVYLGLRQFRAAPDGSHPMARRGRSLFWQGFWVSWANPKTLLFFAAFFPQFIDPALPAGPQLVLLCITFQTIAILIDGGYALLAGRIGRRLRNGLGSERGTRLRNRLTGGLLLGAGLGLALIKRE